MEEGEKYYAVYDGSNDLLELINVQ